MTRISQTQGNGETDPRVHDRGALYRQLLDLVSDAIMLVDNETGQILETNLSATAVYGYSREEWLKLRYPDISAEPEATRQTIQEHVARVPLRWHRRKDGRVFPVDVTISQFIWQGRDVHMAAILDISDRKRTEEALSRSEQKYGRLYRSVLDGLVTVTMDGQIVEANQAYLDMLGYSAEEITQLRYQDITPQRWQAFEAALTEQQVHVRGYSDVYEKEYIRKDGVVFPVELRSYLIRDGEGKATGMWAFVRDITERKRVEELLKLANDELERKVKERTARLRELTIELTRNEQRERRRIAHVLHEDLQQLLAAAKYRVGELQECAANEDRRPLAEAAQSALDHAIQISRTLTVDLRPPVLYEFGLHAALEWLCQDMQSRFGMAVSFRSNETLEPASDDVRFFAFEAVRELLLNVAKHAGVKQAEVQVVPGDPDMFRLQVRDDGKGFHLTDNATRTFGLFSIRERAEGLGGGLTVDSAPGKGTCIRLSLPAR